MRTFNFALTLGACALALAACGGGEEKAAEAPAAAATASSAVPTGSGPKITPGLWEETSTIEGVGANTVKQCVGEEQTDLVAAVGTQSGGSCNSTATPVAGGWQVDIKCDLGPTGTMVSKGTMKGDFTTSYTSEAVMTRSGADGKEAATAKVSATAKNLGACPEGMGPGAVDNGKMIIDPSGMKK